MTILGGSPQLVNVGKWVYTEHPPVVSERILLTILTHNDSAGLAHTNKTYFKLSTSRLLLLHFPCWIILVSYLFLSPLHIIYLGKL